MKSEYKDKEPPDRTLKESGSQGHARPRTRVLQGLPALEDLSSGGLGASRGPGDTAPSLGSSQVGLRIKLGPRAQQEEARHGLGESSCGKQAGPRRACDTNPGHPRGQGPESAAGRAVPEQGPVGGPRSLREAPTAAAPPHLLPLG